MNTEHFFHSTIRSSQNHIFPRLSKISHHLVDSNPEFFTWLEWTAQSVADVMICMGGFIPFLPQYLKIRRTKSSKGFSANVCMALLISNITRLFFWAVRPFRWPLLVQACVNVAIMTEMLRACKAINRTLLRQISLLCLVCGCSCLIFGNQRIFVDALGLFAVSAEACLGMPQVVLNYNRKSTSGLSFIMIALWFIGDILKLCYFIVGINDFPFQFMLATCIQCSVDVIIISQTIYYSRIVKV